MEEKKIKVKLIVHPDYSKEVRCGECGALLFKAQLSLRKSNTPLGIEVKCRRCGKLNQF